MINQIVLENIMKDYEEKFEADTFKIEKVTEEILSSMIQTCDNTKHMEEVVEWYDDEEDPQLNTWVDVEGEGYGWVWLQEEEDESKWHGLLKNRMLRYIEEKKEHIKEQDDYVIIIEASNRTFYHFVEREKEWRDIVYTFTNEEIN